MSTANLAHGHLALEHTEFLHVWVGIAPALKDCVRRFQVLNVSEPKQILIKSMNTIMITLMIKFMLLSWRPQPYFCWKFYSILFIMKILKHAAFLRSLTSVFITCIILCILLHTSSTSIPLFNFWHISK